MTPTARQPCRRSSLAATLLLLFVCAALSGGVRAQTPQTAIATENSTGEASGDPLSGLFGGPFSLVDQFGQRRRDTDFHGRFMLVYFGYSFCPDMCPMDMTQMAAALDMLGTRAAPVQPIFITVDPARDDPAALRDYVPHFHPTLIGLTGTEAEIAAAASAYRVHRFRIEEGAAHDHTNAGMNTGAHMDADIDTDAAADNADDYLVSHSPNLFLMGPTGAFLTLIPHGTPAARMAAILGSYLPPEGDQSG